MHLQTLWPRCGRRETTAAHISAAWASPGQEAELAVAGRRGGAGRAEPISLTESLSQRQAWRHNFGGPGSETITYFKLATAEH